jgi:hypothetical protein
MRLHGRRRVVREAQNPGHFQLFALYRLETSAAAKPVRFGIRHRGGRKIPSDRPWKAKQPRPAHEHHRQRESDEPVPAVGRPHSLSIQLLETGAPRWQSAGHYLPAGPEIRKGRQPRGGKTYGEDCRRAQCAGRVLLLRRPTRVGVGRQHQCGLELPGERRLTMSGTVKELQSGRRPGARCPLDWDEAVERTRKTGAFAPLETSLELVYCEHNHGEHCAHR